jgi:hypothetical protein
MVLGRNRTQQPERTFGNRRESRARSLDLLPKCGFGTRERVVANERAVGDEIDDVATQLPRG